MRTSTTQIFQAGISAIQRAQSNYNHTNLQMATGRRILTPADDPGGATQVVRLDAAIKNVEQYQRNADYALPHLEEEESALGAVEDAMQRVRELVVAAHNDTFNEDDRISAARELEQIRDDILAIANTRDANGEYLFAGTRSDVRPFVTADDGSVSYVGASGDGAVREVDISDTRQIATGDTGDYLFMEIPERSGLLTESLASPDNTGDLEIWETDIANLDEALDSAGETFTIHFSVDETTGVTEYQVFDSDGFGVQDSAGELIGGLYIPNEPIKFGGREITFTDEPTAPADGDEFISRPVKTVSLFDTIDGIATALRMPIVDDEARQDLAESAAMALRNLDSALDRERDIRASVGMRLQTVDIQTNFNAERQINLEAAASEVRDLDYAEAISRFTQQDVVLQAAQQTYVKVSRLSLFDFL